MSAGAPSALKLVDGADANKRAEALQSFAAGHATGTVEFYAGSDDVTDTTYIYIRDGDNSNAISMWFTADKLYYYDGSAHEIMAVSDDTLYHFRVEFDCADDWHLWIDGVSKDGGAGYGYNGAPAAMDALWFSTDNTSTSYNSYLDALGYSWDSDYDIGDNLLHDAIIKTNSIKTEDIIANEWESGKIGYESPFEYVRAKYVQDDDGAIGSYDMIDDLQAIRDLEIADIPQLINNRVLPVYKLETIPWAKREVEVIEYEDPEDPTSPVINRYTKIVGNRYNNSGEKIGFLLSSLKRLLEYIDNLEARLKALEDAQLQAREVSKN